MPSRSDISRASVLAAIREFDRLGAEAFHDTYGYGRAKAFGLSHRGRIYPPKAILGLAYGIEFNCPPLRPSEFSGGVEHCLRLLARLRFRVFHGDVPLTARMLSSALRFFARCRRRIAPLTAKAHAHLIGLVGCTKDKEEEPCKARDLYGKSWVFRMSVRYVESKCREWYVLSGKYGVVEPDRVIAPYEKAVSEMPKAEYAEWCALIQDGVRERVTGSRPTLILMAGEKYAKPVRALGLPVQEPLAGMSTGARRKWLAENVSRPEPRSKAPIRIARYRPRGEDGRIRYILPDSQDCVDPSFNFDRETRSMDRVRIRDDHFAHEAFAHRVHDGMLLSKAIVEPAPGSTGHFAQSQRLRLFREGVRGFYRLPDDAISMGDCGAFTYVKEEMPPFTVDDVVEFYDSCGFDWGVSLDHIVTEYRPDWDAGALFDPVPPSVRQRQELTIELAREFWSRSKGQRFEPVGVAQGWSPRSFSESVVALQAIGYTRIAIGGVVSLKSDALLDVARSVSTVRRPGTKFHMLGVARLDCLEGFADCGVASFDSTSPLRQAWMDKRSNYYTHGRSFAALRIPQVGSNTKLKKRIAAGVVDHEDAIDAEREALRQVAAFDAGRVGVGPALRALVNYEAIHSPTESREIDYRETLEAAPWKSCPCEVCKALGHHVIVFRGAERNRRRGFHNVWTFYRKMQGLKGRMVAA